LSESSKKEAHLRKVFDASENLYTKLKKEEEKGRSYLNSLDISIQKFQQLESHMQEVEERIKSTEKILSKLDRKSDLLVEVKQNLEEVINQMGGYRSISDLVYSLQAATLNLQGEHDKIKDILYEELAPIKRKVNRLIQVQSIPWWWPTNWWWKTKISFTARRIDES
jgi:ppGpp synthetase/RelA/SpoT-type nucleotidyltranferase